MVSVPRLYEKIYAAALTRGEASAPRRGLFAWAMRTGTRYQPRKDKRPSDPCSRSSTRGGQLVLAKIRDLVGGPKNFFCPGGRRSPGRSRSSSSRRGS